MQQFFTYPSDFIIYIFDNTYKRGYNFDVVKIFIFLEKIVLILAVESSCDETAVAVVKDGRDILSSVVNSQVKFHEKFGGVVPEIASRKHTEVIASLTEMALNEANIGFNNIDALAVTQKPGLIGSLLVGVNFVKGISIATGLPIVPVNHLKAHVAVNYLEHKELAPPFLGVVASGGHTSIFEVLSYTNFKLIGNTRDDAIGETFDKVARVIDIPYPGGKNLDNLAEKGDEKAYNFPIPKVPDSNYDMSFSGLKTSVINFLNSMEKQKKEIIKEDLAASFRKAAVENLVNKIIKAAIFLKYKSIVVSGGAAANILLRKKLKKECNYRNIKLFIPSLGLCSDNASMVGSQGYYEFLKGNLADLSLNALFRV